MTHEVVFSLRGDRHIGRVAASGLSEAAAYAFCRDLANFPAGTMHYAIVREDGAMLHDTTKDGLLEDAPDGSDEDYDHQDNDDRDAYDADEDGWIHEGNHYNPDGTRK